MTTCGEETTLFNGEPCLVECKDGFAPKDGTSGLFTCEAGTSWKGNLECVPVDCGETVDQLKQGRFEYVDAGGAARDKCTEGTTFGSECQLRCSQWYSEIEGAAVKPFVCQANGLWEGEIDCRGKRCGRDAPVEENTVVWRLTWSHFPPWNRQD